MPYTFKTTVSRDTNLYTKTIGDLLEIGLNMGAIGVLFILGIIMTALGVIGVVFIIVSPVWYAITNDLNMKPSGNAIEYIMQFLGFCLLGFLVSSVPYIIHFLRLKEVYDKLPTPEERLRTFIGQTKEDEFFTLLNSLSEE